MSYLVILIFYFLDYFSFIISTLTSAYINVMV